MYLSICKRKLLTILLFFILNPNSVISVNNDQIQGYLMKFKELKYKQPDSAVFYLEKARIESIGNVKESINIYFLLADFYTFGNGDYKKALDYLDDAEVLTPQIKDLAIHAAIHNRRGYILTILGDTNAALNEYKKGIAIAEKSGNPNTLNNSYVKFAGILIELELFAEAERYFKKALDLADANASIYKDFIYRNMAELYIKQKLYKQAETFLNTALDILDKSGESKRREVRIRLAKTKLAYVYYYTKRYEKALQIALANKQWKLDVKNKDKAVKIDLLLGKIYYVQKKDSLALKHALKAYQCLEEGSASSVKLSCIKLLYLVYERMNQFEKAHEFSKLHLSVSERSPKNSLQKEYLYTKSYNDLLRQQQQLQMVAKTGAETARINTLLITGALIMSIGFGVVFYRRKKSVFLKQIAKREKAKSKIKQKFILEKERAIAKEEELKVYMKILSEDSKNSIKDIKETKKILNELRGFKILTENDWTGFKSIFQNIYPNFFKNFKIQSINYSQGDLKLAALVRLNFNTKEIAEILVISPDSVRKSKYRLRKKMSLTSEKELQKFIYDL